MVYSTRLFVLQYVILFLCFSVLLALRLSRFGKRKLILVFFVRLFDLCLFCFIGFLSLCVWKGLRFVIVALPGLFSYLFFKWSNSSKSGQSNTLSFSNTISQIEVSSVPELTVQFLCRKHNTFRKRYVYGNSLVIITAIGSCRPTV